MTRLKVLHLIDTGDRGGAETVLDTIVGGLDPSVIESRVIVGWDDWLSARMTERGVGVTVVSGDSAADFRYLGGLMREIRRFAPDVVHAHLLGPAVYGSMAAALTTGVPVVCTIHGRPDIPDPDHLRPVKARLVSRAANRVVYVSEDLRAWAEPLLGIPPRRGLVVRNGVVFASEALAPCDRSSLGVDDGEFLVGAVGNVRWAKDYATLVRAAAIVCSRRSDVRFVVAGDKQAGLIEPLESLVAELGLEERFRFLGFRSDASNLVRCFDLFVSSSLTEGLPLATVEAVGLGTPAVLTDVGGVSEIVEDGITGRLVPSRSPRALATGILDALSDPRSSATMARAGQEDVRHRFSARRMCDEYVALYRQLVGDRAPLV